MFRRLSPLRVTLIYALFGSIWIVSSDRIASAFFPSHSEMVFVQTLKGLLFIIISSAFVYLLTSYAVRHFQRSEERYRTLFEFSHEGAALLRDSRFVECNARFCAMLGVGGEEILGRTPWDFSPEYQPNGRSSKEFGQEILEHVLQGEARIFEWRHRRADGTLIDTEISLVRVDVDDESHVLALGRDITERKQAEASLRESQRRLTTLMSNLPGMAYRCRNEAPWTMEFISDGCRELIGCPAEDLIGNRKYTYADFIHPDDRQKVWDDVQSGLQQHRPFELTYRLQTVSGEEKWVWERGRGVFDNEERVLALEGLISDITPLKQAERQRESLEAQLRQAQKMEAIGQLAGSVAHDFNNILTAILGNIELCIGRLRTDVPRGQLLEPMQQVEEGARRAAGLTRQLLAFSRHQVSQPVMLDLNEVLSSLDNMLRRLVPENITLHIEGDTELLSVRADRGQIEQVVINLVVNAADAMPRGGAMTIATANVTLDDSYVASHAEARRGPHVLLAVSDTGHGISADTMEHLFEPFFTTKPLGKGTGLGLSTVYGIVKQAGGDIRAYSEPGRGSTFKVYLPAVEGKAGPAPAREEPTITGGSETLLLCEDDRAVRDMTERMLNSAGYTVLTASHGREAMEIVKRHTGPLNLVVTDVIIPDMNGRELAEALRADRPEVPVLFISGYSANVIAHHGVLDEGVHFLEKPFTYDDLLRHVRKALESA